MIQKNGSSCFCYLQLCQKNISVSVQTCKMNSGATFLSMCRRMPPYKDVSSGSLPHDHKLQPLSAPTLDSENRPPFEVTLFFQGCSGRRHPYLNGRKDWGGGEIIPASYLRWGFAIQPP